jgi:hypothetical protein
MRKVIDAAEKFREAKGKEDAKEVRLFPLDSYQTTPTLIQLNLPENSHSELTIKSTRKLPL